MLNAYFGLSNRINTLVYSLMIGNKFILWPECHHCKTKPKDIFSRELLRTIYFVGVGHGDCNVWCVPTDSDETKVFQAAEFVYNNFLPDFTPEKYDSCIHARWLGYATQVERGLFYQQCERFAKDKTKTFLSSDSFRDEFKNSTNIDFAPPFSREIQFDFDREDATDQINFCKDLKTIWAAKSCLSNSWKSTITDMRSLLKKETYVSLGYDFSNYSCNYAISCNRKKVFLG